MSNIRAFKDTVPLGTPHAELIETLESLLSEAKTGELRGLAYAGLRVGSRPFTGRVNDVADFDKLCVGVIGLHYRMGREIGGADE